VALREAVVDPGARVVDEGDRPAVVVEVDPVEGPQREVE